MFDQKNVNNRIINKNDPRIGYIAKSLIEMDDRIRIFDNCDYYDDSYYPNKDFIYISDRFPKLSHELSHFLEMNDYERLILPDFGMVSVKDSPDYLIFNQRNFFRAATREIRVRTIQLYFDISQGININNHNPLNQYFDDLAKSFIPFGRFKDMKDYDNWKKDLQEKTYKAWSVSRIRYEWEKRLNYVRDWMETK